MRFDQFKEYQQRLSSRDKARAMSNIKNRVMGPRHIQGRKLADVSQPLSLLTFLSLLFILGNANGEQNQSAQDSLDFSSDTSAGLGAFEAFVLFINANVRIAETPDYSLPRDLDAVQYATVSTSVENCRPKEAGVTSGMICTILGKEWVMKLEGPTPFYHSSVVRSGYNNLRFLHRITGVRIPNTQIMQEASQTPYLPILPSSSTNERIIYLSSEYIDNFVSASSFMLPFTEQDGRHQIPREKVIQHIGEQGIIKLAVACTFIDDLILNWGNWGAEQQQLTIIDADLAPNQFEEFVELSLTMSQKFMVNFSLNNLYTMHKIYTHLYQSLQRDINSQDDSRYQLALRVIKFNKDSIGDAIDRVKHKFKDQPDNPDVEINDTLFDSYLNLKNKELPREKKRNRPRIK